MPEIAEVLGFIRDSDVFFYLDADSVDWTSETPVNIIFHCKGKKFEVILSDLKDIESLAASLFYYTKNSRLLCWNLKNVLSFFRKKSQIHINFENKVYDLSVLCSYFSLPKKKPSTCKEAFFLFDHIKNTSSWKAFEKFYDEVFNPLISNVIPNIETNPLVDLVDKKFVYSYYEIEGQSNGRMKTSKVFKDCYLPHSMGEKEKNNLRLSSCDDIFLYFDYKHMEVSVLEWITKDQNLSKILLSGEDLYRSIWQLLIGVEATKEQRKICKNIFLPVIFGQGSNSLSKKLGIDEKIANRLIYKLEKAFPVAFDWVKSQSVDGNYYATDVFGRRRKFQKDELYKIRNFSIQSPSNMICLRKLVKLHNSLSDKSKVCFHIHDGYAISCNKKYLKVVYDSCKKSLEEDEDLFPNLVLRTSCQFGDNLNNLRSYK
jgi:hypothetical protein